MVERDSPASATPRDIHTTHTDTHTDTYSTGDDRVDKWVGRYLGNLDTRRTVREREQ